VPRVDRGYDHPSTSVASHDDDAVAAAVRRKAVADAAVRDDRARAADPGERYYQVREE
jgi:hypothetical protein